MHWELWDTRTANLVGDYEGESDALIVVREALRLHGQDVVEALALGVEHDEEGGDDDALPPVLRRAELTARALATEPTPPSGSGP